MSINSAITPFNCDRASDWSQDSLRLAERLSDVSQFLRSLRVQLRFGELTRAPLRLLRFQILEDVVECDWIAREADTWDADLPTGIGRRHASLQALKDAIEVRNMLFYCVPGAKTANLRIYRQEARREKELIIAGAAERCDKAARSIRSLAMRAHMLGFRFSLESGILNKLPPEAHLRAGA